MHTNSARNQYEQPANPSPLSETGSKDRPSQLSQPSISCYGCQAQNPPTRRFCRDCGKNLWKACASCGRECPIDESFCGQCGVNMAEMEQKEIRSIKARVHEAQQLRKQLQLSEALLALKAISRRPSQPWLEGVMEAVSELIADVSAQQIRLGEETAKTLARAQQYMENHDYKGVVDELQTIPTPLRDERVRQLLKKAQSSQEEIESLKEQVRNNIDSNLSDLALRIDRILALHPDDAQAQRWAQQVGARILKKAKHKLALHEYAESLELVDSLPSSECDEAIVKFRGQIAELDWCAAELELAPFVSQTTLHAARRLLATDSNNPQARKRYELLKSKQNDGTMGPLPWTASPTRTSVGPPVNPAPTLKRLRVGKNAQACLSDHPGCMYVAVGLALQAVTEVDISTDLLRRNDKSLFKKLGRSLYQRPAKTGWGIDLSDSGVKAVHISPDDNGNLAIDQAHYTRHTKDTTRCSSASERDALLEESLLKLVSACGIKPDERVVTNWPAIRLLTRFSSIPAAGGRRQKELIHYEAQHQIPFPLDNVHWDYELMGSTQDVANGHQEILLLACKSQDVGQHLAIFDRAKLRIAALQCDAVALHNFLRYEAPPTGSPAPDVRPCTAMADIGHDTTNLVLSLPKSLWYRSLRWGPADLEKALVKNFNLTHNQATLLLQQPQRGPSLERHAYRTVTPLCSIAEAGSTGQCRIPHNPIR